MKEEMGNQPDGAAVHIPPPPGLAMPVPMDVDNAIPHPDAATPLPELPVQGGATIVDVDNDGPAEASWPTHRLTSKQSPPHQ
eukprot:1591606-Amphidinium_carterae.1